MEPESLGTGMDGFVQAESQKALLQGNYIGQKIARRVNGQLNVVTEMP